MSAWTHVHTLWIMVKGKNEIVNMGQLERLVLMAEDELTQYSTDAHSN